MSWKEKNSFSSKRSLSDADNGAPAELFEFKVVMVGTVGVGKTSIASRYVKDTYREFVNQTIGASYLWRKERIDEKEVKFSLWDTAGQEQFYALVPMYFRDAEAVILVVDATRDTCEEEASMWLEKIKLSAPPTTSVFLALNKIDLEDKRRFSLNRADAFCRSTSSSFRLECAEVSAKSGEGISELFERIGRKCLQKVMTGNDVKKNENAVRLGTSPRKQRSSQSQPSNQGGKEGRCEKC